MCMNSLSDKDLSVAEATKLYRKLCGLNYVGRHL